MTDLRRKLELGDYQKIRFYSFMNYTIREIATEFGISTKYVKKILNRQTGLVEADIGEVRHYDCSGCGRIFSFSGIGEHFSIWTSGENPLSCMSTIAGLSMS